MAVTPAAALGAGTVEPLRSFEGRGEIGLQGSRLLDFLSRLVQNGRLGCGHFGKSGGRGPQGRLWRNMSILRLQARQGAISRHGHTRLFGGLQLPHCHWVQSLKDSKAGDVVRH